MATDADIQLSDMLESYPSSMTPGFQTLITSKKEFSELSSNPIDRLPPGRGQYFKHQKFTHRFLRAYDHLIILSETGTGKSCETLGFTEYVRKEVEKAKIDPLMADEKVAHFKKFIILVKGRTQKDELRLQLACKCSDGHYESGIVKRAVNSRVQKSNLTLEIKKAGYSLKTYISFAHDIARLYPTDDDNERLAEDFADTIFWVDEAHNLLVDPSDMGKYKEKNETYTTLWRLFHLARRSKVIITTATPMINDSVEIGSLMNLILPLNGDLPIGYDYRTAPANDIRVLFPGLPVDPRFATREQVAPYFQGQFPPTYDFNTATLQDLEPFMRGKIGFIRASDTGAVPVEQGIPQNDIYETNGISYQSQLVLYPTLMSEHQTFGVEGGGGGYVMSKQAIRGRDDLSGNVMSKQATRGRDYLSGAQRQASNFVFPDGYWGNGITEEERETRKITKQAKAATKAAIAAGQEGGPPVRIEELPAGGLLPILAGVDTEKEFELDQTERRAFRRYVFIKGDTYSATTEFSYWLRDLTYIRYLSCKYAEIVRLLIEDPGNAFVYGEFIDGSGAIVLALCLEGMGFERFDESSSIFLGSGAEHVRPLCGGSNIRSVNRRVRILSRQEGARPRYALLTGVTSSSKNLAMMEAMNSYENRHGEYIKVLISSRVGRDAINVNNILQIHLVGPEWNQSSMYQALSRGIRATSHVDLLEELQETIRAEKGDSSAARLIVKIYKHAAVAINDEGSIDVEMYGVSEYKDRNIKRIMRIMKQCAIGCQVHRNRNIRPTDVDRSAACDYDVCNYDCVDPPPDEEDYSTYDVLYAGEIVTDAARDIMDIYRQWNALTLDTIANALPQYRRKYLVMALERLITNKTPLVDRFGYTTYLREDKGSFYLDRSYPTDVPASYAMSYYTQGVIGIEQETLANIVVKLEAGEHREIFAELETLDPDDPQFDLRLRAISIEGQASILEDVIIRSLRGQRSKFTNAVITKFQRMVFPINEPVTELNRAYEQLTVRRLRRGRKRNPESRRRIKKINPITAEENEVPQDEGEELVYLHTVYSQVINQTAYATTARFNKGEGRTRLLKPSELEEGWRDLNEMELPVYNEFIQVEIAKRNRPYEDTGLYGMVLLDREFRILDRITQAAGADKDARKIKRGKVCKTWYRPDLIDVMWQIGVQEPGGVFPDFREGNEQEIIRALSQRRINKTPEELLTWSLPRLIYYFKWYSATKIKRTILCELIKARMAETGRLLE